MRPGGLPTQPVPAPPTRSDRSLAPTHPAPTMHPSCPILLRFGQGAFAEMVRALHARMVAEAAAAGHPPLPPLQVRTGWGGRGSRSWHRWAII